MLLVQILTLCTLIGICYQDLKERLVYWFLFPAVAFMLAFLHFNTIGWLNFIWNSIFNIVLVSCMLLLLKVYMRFRFRNSGFKNYFGLGDILFLYAIALGFATIAFFTLLVFSLLFALLLHSVLTSKLFTKRLSSTSVNCRHQRISIPLAGYMSIFYGGILLIHWLVGYDQIYIL